MTLKNICSTTEMYVKLNIIASESNKQIMSCKFIVLARCKV